MARQQPLHAPEEGPLAGNETQIKKIMDGLVIRLPQYSGVLKDRLDFGGKAQGPTVKMIMQGLDTKIIPDQ